MHPKICNFACFFWYLQFMHSFALKIFARLLFKLHIKFVYLKSIDKHKIRVVKLLLPYHFNVHLKWKWVIKLDQEKLLHKKYKKKHSLGRWLKSWCFFQGDTLHWLQSPALFLLGKLAHQAIIMLRSALCCCIPTSPWGPVLRFSILSIPT